MTKKSLIKPMPSDDKNGIFTEDKDYLKTKKGSIWGKMTKRTITKISEFFGNKPHILLDLGCGDGRYTRFLKQFADKVIGLDIDPSPLLKIMRDLPDFERENIKLVQANIKKSLPFETGGIDAVFSTGLLHLFEPNVFRKIALEINRVLRPEGKVLLDFGINIKRVELETELPYKPGKKPSLNRKEAVDMIRSAFPGFEIKFNDGDKMKRKFKDANPPYKIHCENLLVTAIKNG